MGFRCGIIGLPNVGKSTIFNGLTSQAADAQNYPFCTIDPNVGVVELRDSRIASLAALVKPQRVVPAVVEFVDIAGLVRGASQGEGLGNQFLSHIRQAHALAHVVRCFADDDVAHVEGSVDPIRDIEVVETELIFADAETVTKNLARYRRQAKAGGKEIDAIIAMLASLEAHLQALKPARSFLMAGLGDSETLAKAFVDLHLITAKKTLYVCNVDEALANGLQDNVYTERVRARADTEGAGVVIISGKIESEISVLDPDERQEILDGLDMQESGLDRLSRAAYDLLGFMTYFTAGEKEVRAWTIKRGVTAPEAAGVIHSDFERGFICAEVYTIPDLVAAKSKAKLKETGKIRLEGKSYVVQDGDVMEFRFNV